MKKIFIALITIGLLQSSQAQTQMEKAKGIIQNSQYFLNPLANNQYQIVFHTAFSIGYGSSCPPFMGIIKDTSTATLKIAALYDIRGIWQFVGCERWDTVVVPKGSFTNVKLSTAGIIEDNTNSGLAIRFGIFTTPPLICHLRA